MADPIHGVIRLNRYNENHRMLLDVMNSRAFQRLRRIKQMGLAEFVFPGATHSRFVHSIGAAWLMIKTLDYFTEQEDTRRLLRAEYANMGVTLERVLLLAILVHDIGHTPLSHTLEDILGLKDKGLLHDVYWNRLILEEDEELQGIWRRYGENLPKAVAMFCDMDSEGHPGPNRHFLCDLVSSQLDMDRLDYLLRDSHYLGVQYGRVEVERIITNMCIGTTQDGKKAIALREEAIPAVEHYLFGRYEAYKMALHSLDKASETLLKKTLERFKWVKEADLDPGHPADLLYRLMVDGRTLTVDEYLMLDDCYLWDKVNLWARYSEDPLLKDLSNRLLGHDLYKYLEISHYQLTEDQLEQVYDAMKSHYESRELSFTFGFEVMHVSPRPLYQHSHAKPPIWVKGKNPRLVDLADLSTLPLHHEVPRGHRQLVFVWDREAKTYLKRFIEETFVKRAAG